MKYRLRYDEDQDLDIGEKTAIDFSDDPGMTLQEPTEDADINVLMQRMGIKDGSKLPYFTSPEMLYGDFSEMPTDPVEVAEILHQGQLAFMSIPGNIRQRFQNPEELFQFMQDDNNYEEAVRIGLLKRKEQPPAPLPETPKVPEAPKP